MLAKKEAEMMGAGAGAGAGDWDTGVADAGGVGGGVGSGAGPAGKISAIVGRLRMRSAGVGGAALAMLPRSTSGMA
jgi:hypothetical protein